MSAERRRHPRFPVAAPATLFVLGYLAPFTAAITNLSRSGCFVATRGRVWTGTSVAISFSAGASSCLATGLVVRDEPNVGVGVEFSNANDALAAFVAGIVAADAADRKALVESVSSVEIRVG